ncbi:hypothetical protein ENBRE01_1185, partial [Enteropsectra breve]
MILSNHMANTTKLQRAASEARGQEAKQLMVEMHVLHEEAKRVARYDYFRWAWPKMSRELKGFISANIVSRNKRRLIPVWIEVVEAVQNYYIGAKDRLWKEKTRKCYLCGRKGHDGNNCWGVLDDRVRGENAKRLGRKENVKNIRAIKWKREAEDAGVIDKRLKGENSETIEVKQMTEDRTTSKINDIERNNDLNKLIKKYPEVLGPQEGQIKWCSLEKCRIKTKGNDKVVKKGQAVPQALIEKANVYFRDLEQRGVIRRSDSDWRNPIRVLQKPDGNIRVVSNLIALNSLVEKDPMELRNIREVIRATAGAIYFSVFDLKEAFYTIEICEEDKKKTAFEFNGKVYEWNS